MLLENIDELDLGAMTIEQRHNLYNVIKALGANIEQKFVSSNSGDYIDFKIKIFRKLKDFINVRPRKKGYSLRFYLPEEETCNKYENLTQAANQYGYTYKAYNDVHVYRFSATIKDSESENGAYEFIRMIYKAWMDYIENLDKE